MSQFRFPKSEKLKDEHAIKDLFENGKKIKFYPILFLYGTIKRAPIEKKAPPTIQCAFTVSKRRFKKATDRNRIKRVMREAYRLQKHKIAEVITSAETDDQVGLIMLYIGKEIPIFSSVNKAINRFILKQPAE